MDINSQQGRSPEDKVASPMRVLIVDDQPKNLEVLEAVLDGMNLELVRATSAKEALRHLLKMDVALILLDVRMPVIDGFETARLIRNRPRSANTPIIFLTAYQSDEKMIFEGYRTGAVDFISKPIIPEILRSKVAIFTDLFEKTRQLRRMNETLEQQVAAQTAEVRRAEAQFRHIFEFALDGIYQVHHGGRRYAMANPAMAEILGYPSSTALIEEVEDIQTDVYANPDDFVIFHDLLSRTGFVNAFEVRMLRADGEVIWVSKNARVWRDEVGRLIGHEGMLRDITQQKKAEEQLAAKNKDLQTLLYVTSHDFKEPLRGILGYTYDIARATSTKLPNHMRESIDHIIEEAERLDTLIDSVRTLIQAQQISSDMKEVEAESLIHQSLAPLQRRIEETGAQITISPELPILLANERWLVHALTNLIGNAIKFCRPGEQPVIDIEPCPEDRCRSGNGLIIRDRGIGVPAAHRERIFELFKRGGNHEMEGTGAGLAIVAQIAKAHGGLAWVEEREGGGSDFYLALGTKGRSTSSGTVRYR